jgi:Fe-coproporphyrin III synthase
MHVFNLKDSQVIIRPSDAVKKVYLELTSECNFDCDMCFRHGFSMSFGTMPVDTLTRVLNEIRMLPWLEEVVIGGIGEPLLHPAFPEVVTELKKKGLKVSITSTGALAIPHIDLLVENHVDALYLSFETGDIGHTNEDVILDLARQLEQRKKAMESSTPAVHLSMVVTRSNIKDLERLANTIRGIDISTIFMSNLLPTDVSHESLSLYLKPEPAEIRQFRNRLFQKVLLEKTKCTVPKFEIRTERFCEFVEQNALVIRWDGDIAPCYRFLHTSREIVEGRQKEIKACTFGNIRQTSLLDIWNDRSYAWFRFMVHHSIYPSCIDCPLKDGCEFIKSTESDCWGNENSCADCLWSRGIVRCP